MKLADMFSIEKESNLLYLTTGSQQDLLADTEHTHAKVAMKQGV